MVRQLITNIRTNLMFYRRSRLLRAIVLFLLFIWGLMLIPSILFITSTTRFEIIKHIFCQLSVFSTFLTVILGTSALFHHIRSRCIKMVITKPCLPEIWLLSNLLSPIIVCFTLYMLTFLICLALFMIWGIPIQWGLIYITLDSFFKAIVILSYLMFLITIFHPIIAVLFALIIQENTIYLLLTWIMVGLETVENPVHKVLLQWLKPIFYFIYMILPTEPFSDKTLSIYNSLRVTITDLKYLFSTFGYTMILASFFYLLADYFLKKKRHI